MNRFKEMVEVIAGAAAAQVVKERMEHEAHSGRPPVRERRPARPRLALAAALHRAAARLERPITAR